MFLHRLITYGFILVAGLSGVAHSGIQNETESGKANNRPLIISSWHGNNFGVVAELRGSYRLEGQRLTVSAESLRLRQVVSCQYGCVTIKQVRVAVYGESGPENFSSHAESEPLAVGRTFDRGAVLDLGGQEFVLKLEPETPLTRLWLGIEIEETKGGHYYAHTPRNFFAREFAQMGWGQDACANVSTEVAAIETGCHAALTRKLESWSRPFTAWFDRVRGRPDPVWVALHENSAEAVRILRRHDVDIDIPGDNGETPLMLAAANGSTEMVRAFLENGANPNRTIPRGKQAGRTALIGAISARSAEAVELLLSHGGRADLADAHGWLPVHYAVYYDNTPSLEILEMLVKHGVNLDAPAPGQRAETPLMVAAQYAKTDAIRFLLARGARRNAQDRHGKNARDYAEFFNQSEAVLLLEP